MQKLIGRCGFLMAVSALLLAWALPAQAGSTHWRIGVSTGSSPRWHLGYHDFHHHRFHRHGWHLGVSDFHHRFHRHHHGRWSHDPWHRHRRHYDRWHGDPWVSWSWSSPFIRHRDLWTERAVPRRTIVVEPAAPTPTERALKAFGQSSATSRTIPTSTAGQDEPEKDGKEDASPDGAELAGEGLAALARKDFPTAVSLLRKAFEQDPANAALAADNPRFRAMCNRLKQELLYRHPYSLAAADAQFLRAVLYLYTGDHASAGFTARSIRDDAVSTVRLRAAAGSQASVGARR